MFWNDKRIKELEERVKALEEKGLSVQIIAAPDKTEPVSKTCKKCRVSKEPKESPVDVAHTSENDK